MVKEILIHPDPRLYTVSTDIDTFFDHHSLWGRTRYELEQDLKDTMTYAKGIAIAGIQIGVPVRVMVIGDTCYWNPRITQVSDSSSLVEEGCLSLPGIVDTVMRPRSLTLEYLDSSLKPQSKELTGLYAQAAEHEMEHMAGKTMISGMPINKADSARAKMKKLHRMAAKRGITPFEFVYGRPKEWST